MLAIDDRTSIPWARVVRGIASRAMKLPLRAARRATIGCSWPPPKVQTRVAPSFRSSTSWSTPSWSHSGGPMRSTTSAWRHTEAASGTMRAPASMYAVSVNIALRPAPLSKITS